MKPFSFAVANCGDFSQYIPLISQKAKNRTCFLYIDPYSVKGLNWAALEDIFCHVSNSSVEVLLNFNTPHFLRLAWKALKTRPKGVTDEMLREIDSDAYETIPPSMEALDIIVGGNWWKEILENSSNFHEQCNQLAEALRTRLGQYFKHAIYTRVGEQPDSPIPKYHMLFGSRHSDALILMNDEMIRATGDGESSQNLLFWENQLQGLILRGAANWITQDELVVSLINENFCKYMRKEIMAGIEDLVIHDKLIRQKGNKGVLLKAN